MPLERLLAQTMSTDPRLRPKSAIDLADALNAIEQSLYGYDNATPFSFDIVAGKGVPKQNPTTDLGAEWGLPLHGKWDRRWRRSHLFSVG